MPNTPKEMERIILADGWYEVAQRGSHRHISILPKMERLQYHSIPEIYRKR